jgi:hypothetical protein
MKSSSSPGGEKYLLTSCNGEILLKVPDRARKAGHPFVFTEQDGRRRLRDLAGQRGLSGSILSRDEVQGRHGAILSALTWSNTWVRLEEGRPLAPRAGSVRPEKQRSALTLTGGRGGLCTSTIPFTNDGIRVCRSPV